MSYRKETGKNSITNYLQDFTVYSSSISNPHTYFTKYLDFSDIEIGEAIEFEILGNASLTSKSVILEVAGTAILTQPATSFEEGMILRGMIVKTSDTNCTIVAEALIDPGVASTLVETTIGDPSVYLSSSTSFVLKRSGSTTANDLNIYSVKVNKIKIV